MQIDQSEDAEDLARAVHEATAALNAATLAATAAGLDVELTTKAFERYGANGAGAKLACFVSYTRSFGPAPEED